MNKFNMNHEVIIYPNKKGWNKIYTLISELYSISYDESVEWVKQRKTKDNGYKCQLWVIINDLHKMFYNGQQYFKHTSIDLINNS